MVHGHSKWISNVRGYQSISRFNDNVIPNQSVTSQVVFFFFCDLSIGIIVVSKIYNICSVLEIIIIGSLSICMEYFYNAICNTIRLKFIYNLLR